MKAYVILDEDPTDNSAGFLQCHGDTIMSLNRAKVEQLMEEAIQYFRDLGEYDSNYSILEIEIHEGYTPILDRAEESNNATLS